MRVGYLQLDSKFGKVKENINKVRSMIREKSFDLLVLPEMFNTGYMVESRKELKNISEEVPNGFTTKEIIKIAKEKNAYIVFGLPEIDNEKLYSTAVIVGPDGFKGKIRKVQLFFKENLYFDKGDLPYEVYDIGKAKIGIAVCYAYMFPEVWRTLAMKGADIFCNIANLVYPYCLKVMEVRSLENGVFTIVTNRTGTERGNKFFGNSKIIDVRGDVLKQASSDNEEIAIVEIDINEARNKQWNQYNNLFKDRRPEFYLELGNIKV